LKRLALLCTIVAAAGLATVPAAAGARTYLGACSSGERAAYKPNQVLVACADGNFLIFHLKWSSWGKRSAHGTGTARVNTCKPDCASGKFHKYPVKVALGRPRSCSRGPGRQFKRVTYTFTGSRPAGVERSGYSTRVCGRSR
jgi:hypothetical protein